MVAAVSAAAVLFAVALAHLDAAAAAYVDLKLEQSFGAEFLPAGTVKGDLDGQGFGGLELQRTAWSTDDTQKFAQLARDDGFYRLRLQPGSGSGGHVLASLRARCLAAAGFQERLTLHVGSDGSVTGLQYDAAAPGGCPPGLPLTAGQLEGLVPGTAPQPVAVAQPASAPRILLGDYLPAQHPAGAVGAPMGLPLNVAVQPQVQRQRQQQGPGGGDGSGAQGKPAPKPDERTWIQKNWLFLVPIGLIIFNQLGGLQAPQQGASGSGGGGGS